LSCRKCENIITNNNFLQEPSYNYTRVSGQEDIIHKIESLSYTPAKNKLKFKIKHKISFTLILQKNTNLFINLTKHVYELYEQSHEILIEKADEIWRDVPF
jgi:hypothetical protein